MKRFSHLYLIIFIASFGLCGNAISQTTIVTIDPGTGGTSFKERTFSFNELDGHNLDPIGPLEFVFTDSKFITLSMKDDFVFDAILNLTFTEAGTDFVPVAGGSLRDGVNYIASNNHGSAGGITDTYTMGWLTWNNPLIDGFKFSSVYFNNVGIRPHPENTTIVSASLTLRIWGNIHNGVAEIGPIPKDDGLFLVVPLPNGKATILNL